MKNKKIVYVNYAPYENQGNILDFLLEEYDYVFLFSIGHHNLGKNQITNKITVYKNKKIIKEIHLYYLYTATKFVYAAIPFRSFLNFIQIIWQCGKLRDEYGNLDVYFTVNGFTAWVGLVLKKLGLVGNTVYWVCDYYPTTSKDKMVKIMRWLYWQFDKRTKSSDILAFHNNRIVDVWKKNNVLPKNYKAILVPIATSRPIKDTLVNKNYKKIRLCFLGVLKKSMGLDYIIDSADLLSKEFPGIIIDVIGPGPDKEYFKARAKRTSAIFNFYGYVLEGSIEKLVSRCTIGIAPYMPDPSNVSYYADSAKMKKYISLGLPVIATKVHEFSEEVEKCKSGIIVTYGDSQQLVNAIKEINKNYVSIVKNVIKLNNSYFYKSIYPKLFDFNDRNNYGS